MAKRQVKGPKVKPTAAKIATNKRAVYAEKVKQAEQHAYDRAYKQAAIQAAKAKGRADALNDAAKKGKGRK